MGQTLDVMKRDIPLEFQKSRNSLQAGEVTDQPEIPQASGQVLRKTQQRRQD
jgi:hypothetical protein